jgi:D-cysteine desulfhydrase
MVAMSDSVCPDVVYPDVVYPDRVRLAHTPTPLQPLDRLSDELGGPRIWVKRDDLTGFGLSGNKVRKLEFCIADALAQGCDTLITCGGVQSNHCRATAVAARQLGLGVHLVLRADSPPDADGNLFIDELLGATITHVSRKTYARRLDAIYQELIADYARQGKKAYTMPVGASDEVGLWGYIAACEELQADFARHGIAPGHLVCATGSGGTQGGLSLGAVLFGMDAQVWGVNVCDDADYFYHKIRADILACQTRYPLAVGPDDVSIETIDGYVGPGYGVADPEVFETIKRVAQLEGLLLDPIYTGKAFYGMMREIDRGERFAGADDIVFIHTGGFFSAYAQRQQFARKESDRR